MLARLRAVGGQGRLACDTRAAFRADFIVSRGYYVLLVAILCLSRELIPRSVLMLLPRKCLYEQVPLMLVTPRID